MKFSQLADGQQFEYQGVVYTRNGPIMAIDAEGNSRMIPRSAEVKPFGTVAEKPRLDLTQTITIETALAQHGKILDELRQCITAHGDDAGNVSTSTVEECLVMADQKFRAKITG